MNPPAVRIQVTKESYDELRKLPRFTEYFSELGTVGFLPLLDDQYMEITIAQ